MPQSLHFAALSGKSFDNVASALGASLALTLTRPAEGDAHRDEAWEYATATLADGTQLNLTRTDDFDAIATWEAGAPTGVNWQLMLTRDAGLDTDLVDQVCQAVHAALGARLAVYRMV